MRTKRSSGVHHGQELRRIDCVSALITRRSLKDDQVLLVWNQDWRTPSWSLPGGAREDRESLSEAAAREVREETGLNIEVRGLVDLHEIIGLGGRHHLVIFTFDGRVTGGSLIADGGGEPEQGGVTVARWFSVDEARAIPTVARVLQAKLASANGTSCSCDRKVRIRTPRSSNEPAMRRRA